MMDMFYELFMRFAYKCGRNYSKGADADLFRRMKRDYRRTGELGESAIKVVDFLYGAFAKVETDYKSDKDLVTTITECRKLILFPTYEKIESAIGKAYKATTKYTKD